MGYDLCQDGISFCLLAAVRTGDDAHMGVCYYILFGCSFLLCCITFPVSLCFVFSVCLQKGEIVLGRGKRLGKGTTPPVSSPRFTVALVANCTLHLYNLDLFSWWGWGKEIERMGIGRGRLLG